MQPGKIQQIIDQVGQAAGLIYNNLHVFRGIFAGQVAHYLGIAGDHGQRGAQVMAYIGNKFLPQVLHFAQLPAGVVQGVGQFGDFAVGTAGKVGAVIAGGQLFGALGNADIGF